MARLSTIPSDVPADASAKRRVRPDTSRAVPASPDAGGAGDTAAIPLALPSRAAGKARPLVTLEDAQAEALRLAGLTGGAESGDDDGDGGPYDEGDGGSSDDGDAVAAAADDDSDGTEWDEFFDSLQLTVPFCFLYLMLDILTNLSYSRHPDWKHYAQNLATAVPTIGMIVFYSSRYLYHPAVRVLLLATCIGAGTRLIWLVNKAPYLVVMGQAPAVGTLWILTVIQLPLGHVAAALAVVAAWSWAAKMKFRP